MLIAAPTARMLGILAEGAASTSLLALAIEVDNGLSLSALDWVVHQVAPADNAFVFRLVPRATLARRRKGVPSRAKEARLSPEEGAKVVRLAEVWALAREVWGSDEEARAFLFRAHPMLDGRSPIDVVLANEFGRPIVEEILGGLQYGSAA